MDWLIRTTADVPMPILSLAAAVIIFGIAGAIYWIALPDIERHDAEQIAKRLRADDLSGRDRTGYRR